MKLKQFYLRTDQIKKLEKRSTKDLSQAEIVRRALDQFLTKATKQ